MRRRLSVRLRSDNPAGKGHFTILVVAPNPSSPASRGRITVYVPILCCVGRADPSRPHGLFSVTCIFFSTQRLTIQTGKLRDRTSWGTGGYPDEADTDRGHGRAHGHACGVALCRKPRIGGRSSRARAGACLLTGRHGLQLGRGIYRNQWRLRGRAKRVGQRSAQSVRPFNRELQCQRRSGRRDNRRERPVGRMGVRRRRRF